MNPSDSPLHVQRKRHIQDGSNGPRRPHNTERARSKPTDKAESGLAEIVKNVADEWNHAWPKVTAAIIIIFVVGLPVVLADLLATQKLSPKDALPHETLSRSNHTVAATAFGSTVAITLDTSSVECLEASKLCLDNGATGRAISLLKTRFDKLETPNVKRAFVREALQQEAFQSIRTNLEDMLIRSVEDEQQERTHDSLLTPQFHP